MNKLQEKIESDFKQALKEKRELELSTLRMLKASFKNEEIRKREELTDEEILKLVKTETKKRKESIESYKQGGRDDLAAKEAEELEFLQRYLPEQVSEEEIKKIVTETIQNLSEMDRQNFGKVMGEVMDRLKGQAEGQLVSKLVKEELEK